MRNQHQRNSSAQVGAAFSQRENGIEHGNYPALHVARAAAKQEMFLADWLELFPGLRGHNIIVSMKVENAFSPSVPGNQTDRDVGGAFFLRARLEARALQPHLLQSVLQKIGK